MLTTNDRRIDNPATVLTQTTDQLAMLAHTLLTATDSPSGRRRPG